MPHFSIPHFEEEGRINRDPGQGSNFWLPSETYGAALDVLVLTCVDLLFVHQGEVLLGRRNRQPIQGWWVIGGRMFPGESPLDAAQRKASTEANIELGRSRFTFLGVYSTCFAVRHQPPTQNGFHSVNLVHVVNVSGAEKNQIQLTPAEYETWAWATPQAFRQQLNPARAIDRALVQMLSDLERLIFTDARTLDF